MGSFLRFAIPLALLAWSAPSFGQATRTWVSAVGDDANPCSRTAPCKTFAGAISKTQSGGEINCLDPGGFGSVTITKSITIDCSATLGSTLNPGTNGIIINDSGSGSPNTAEVLIRGLAINGSASAGGGLNGIRLISGRSLVLQHLFVQNQTAGNGISLQPAGAAEFYAEDVTVTDGATGILIQPTGAGSIRAFLRNVRAQNNSGPGVTISAVGNSSPVGSVVIIDKSFFTGNASGLLTHAPTLATPNIVMITDSVIAGNSSLGLRSAGPGSTIRVGNSTITDNGTGLGLPNNGTINTYGNNRLDGNAATSPFTAPALPQQ